MLHLQWSAGSLNLARKAEIIPIETSRRKPRGLCLQEPSWCLWTALDVSVSLRLYDFVVRRFNSIQGRKQSDWFEFFLSSWVQYSRQMSAIEQVSSRQSDTRDPRHDSRLYYSLNGHPSGPENWPFFQRSRVCTWQCRALKCSATHPAFSPVRNISRLFYFIFLLCQNQFQSRHSRRKWRPLTAWTLGRRISQLSINCGGSQHCEVARALERFYDYVSKVACGRWAMKIAKKMKKRNDLHTPVPVSPLDLSSSHSGKHHGESFFLRLLECMDFVAFCLHLESCSVKVCLNWRRTVNWTFWYQIWVDRGWLEKIAANS